MNRQDLLNEVVDQLRAALPLDGHQVTESDVLRDLPEADSIHLFRVTAKLERRLGVEFDDGVLFAVRTVSDLVDGLVSATAS